MSWWSHCYFSLILSLYTTVYVSFSQGPHIGSWKARLCNSPAIGTNCHLLRVKGAVKNGEGPIVSCHWYAEHCSNTIGTLVGFDQNTLYLYPLICGELSSPCCPQTAPVIENDRNSPVTRPKARPCMSHGGPKLSTLRMKPTLYFFCSNHVFKGTQNKTWVNTSLAELQEEPEICCASTTSIMKGGHLVNNSNHRCSIFLCSE